MSISEPVFFLIDPYSAFYALFAANLVSHNSVFLHRPKKQNAHGGRNVMPRCLSEGVDIFLKSVERQGESGHHFITFRRKFTPGDATSRRDVPFAVGVRGFTQLSAGYHDQRGTGEKASALRRPLPAAMPRRTQAAWRCRDGPR